MLKTIIDNNRTIWQIHLSGGNLVAIEERANKEAFFSVLDTSNNEIILKDYQFEEKSWVGIEQLYRDKIIFHWYQTPEMPYHKGVAIFDINKKEILWKNEFEKFVTVKNDKIYTIMHKMLGEEIKVYEINTGKVSDVITDTKSIENIFNSIDNSYIYKNYLYPLYYDEIDDENIYSVIEKLTSNSSYLLNEIEVIENNKYYYISFQEKIQGNYTNTLVVYNNELQKVVDKIVLNKSNKMIKSSYFVINDNLYLIIDKNKIICTNYTE
ncbi:MAG TPA: DUF4905 domain-containing protein [Ignavibacteriales bacterium]|nr:DUF4905 domain-containing protein [Ignavibacteriales bacterium]